MYTVKRMTQFAMTKVICTFLSQWVIVSVSTNGFLTINYRYDVINKNNNVGVEGLDIHDHSLSLRALSEITAITSVSTFISAVILYVHCIYTDIQIHSFKHRYHDRSSDKGDHMIYTWI
jgi:hypothetical protein